VGKWSLFNIVEAMFVLNKYHMSFVIAIYVWTNFFHIRYLR
jgi:hypothetical protein